MSSTCGEGLAHHAALPEKMADLIAAVADTLDAHLEALDERDPQSKPEHDAYGTLVSEHRVLETALRRLSDRMAGYRGLPMANHDPKMMAGARARSAFRAVVNQERALAGLLTSW